MQHRLGTPHFSNTRVCQKQTHSYKNRYEKHVPQAWQVLGDREAGLTGPSVKTAVGGIKTTILDEPVSENKPKIQRSFNLCGWRNRAAKVMPHYQKNSHQEQSVTDDNANDRVK